MKYALKLLVLVCVPMLLGASNDSKDELLPKYKLSYHGKLEISGIVRSRNNPDVFWIHNDSGDEPRVFAINTEGEFYASARYKNYEGVHINGAINVDWEDLTMDDEGNLIIADVGNNRNDRRDLLLYYIPEPSPIAGKTSVMKKVFIRYPEQKTYPAPQSDFNYDCEAVFFANDKVHLLTKNRSDSKTNLYRLDAIKTNQVNELTLVDSFDTQGKVTAADVSPDALKLIITTYKRIWLFERKTTNERFFDAKVFMYDFNAPQVESACFLNKDTLWLIDEQTAAIYEVPLTHFTPFHK